MKAFSSCHPLSQFIYFLAVCGISMFCMNPVMLLLSLCGAVTLFFSRNGKTGLRSHFLFLLLFLVMALINPLFSHNGVTVLFVMNDNPVTAEALFYGIAASAMIVAVLYWFRSFSQVMTSDRLLYLFGAVSPKLALLFSMALRYVPLFQAQSEKVNRTQKALGLYKEDNLIDQVRGKTRVFSVMVTWALENGIITADSMSARGYGVGRRTSFSIFRFRLADLLLLLFTVIPAGTSITGMLLGSVQFSYYPKTIMGSVTPLTALTYLSYGMLVFLPSISEITERIKWKFLQSKI